MARLPRIDLPGIPQHVVQRGNNRLPCFLDDEDRARYRQLLREALLASDCRLHAYVLMENHVHLLVTPPRAGAIGQLMQRLGRQYVGQFNARHGRTGTLWEGRYKACLVDTTEYLLRCARYIDLNPVRAGMLASAADYPWSSHAHLAGLRHDPLLTPHPLYWQLGNTPFAREQAYVNLVRAGLAPEQHAALGQAAHSGWALGGDDFIADLEKRTARRASRAARGRPVKAEETASN